MLDRNRVKVARVPAKQLPLVDGRCSAQGWCLVEENKDCRPPPPWGSDVRPCEDLNATAQQRQLYRDRFDPRAVIASRARGTLGKIKLNEA